MTRRYFWQVPEFIKFRTVFENGDAILGANENNEHQMFRKDIGKVCFDECVALSLCLKDIVKKQPQDILTQRVHLMAA